ncbi:hypothetical protein M434DRAFT_17118 [Hypoxylon sp. CO27-5]|nr:hypothetical protein M434DRAFT_17118 [Hypoxylon sp. CO27-5]
MAKRTAKVPDAWEDDDWEVQADRAVAEEESGPQPQPQLSRAERLAQHTESNRKIWASAEAPPETFHYLAARSDPPLAIGFKPAVKVLSRKPVVDNGVPDEDEQDKKAPQLTPEEILAKQQREREEKQRRYDEARAKIFGTGTGGGSGVGSSNPSSGTSTPGAVTPPRSADGRGPRGRGRGRGGGGGGGGGGGHRHNESRVWRTGALRSELLA